MKRAWLFVRDLRYYVEFAWFIVKRLLRGCDEVEVVFRSERGVLTIYFDPQTVKGEMRIVEELVSEADGAEHHVQFRREGKLWCDSKHPSAYGVTPR